MGNREFISYKIIIGDHEIEEVNYHEHLCVILDDELSFKKHVNFTISRSFKSWRYIKLMTINLSSSTYCILYKSYVRSVIEHASLAYWQTQDQCNSLQTVQKEIIKQKVYGHHHAEVLQDLGIALLLCQRKVKYMTFLHFIYLKVPGLVTLKRIPECWTVRISFKHTSCNGIAAETQYDRIIFSTEKNLFNTACTNFNSLELETRNAISSNTFT